MSEFDKLKDVFSKVESSWHKLDDKRFKKFLEFAKKSGFPNMTLGSFRGAFEEAQPGRLQIDKTMDNKIIELYKKYEIIKD